MLFLFNKLCGAFGTNTYPQIRQNPLGWFSTYSPSKDFWG
jgi:hypothetical protein